MPRTKNATKAKTPRGRKITKKTADTTKKAAAAAPVPVLAPTPVVQESAPVEAPVSVFAEQFGRLSELTHQLQENFSTGKQFATEIRKLVSAITRFEKKLAKTTGRRAKRTGTKVQSGITRPVRISDQLCSFLGEDKGAMMARTAVTKRITTYIREQNLQNPENRKQIFPDVKLQTLLMPLVPGDRESGYTFFNLQRYLKHHYQKSESATTKTASTSKGATATA